MNTRIINFSDIQKCPTLNLSAEHWVGGHRFEECDPKLRKKLKRFDTTVPKSIRAKARLDIEKRRKSFIRKLRERRSKVNYIVTGLVIILAVALYLMGTHEDDHKYIEIEPFDEKGENK